MAIKFEVFTPDLYVSSGNPNLLTLVRKLEMFFEENPQYELVSVSDASAYGIPGTTLVNYIDVGVDVEVYYRFRLISGARYYDGNFNIKSIVHNLNSKLAEDDEYFSHHIISAGVEPVLLLVTTVVVPLPEYTITYELDGGTNHGSNPSTFTEYTPTITLETPTKSGNDFVGWFDAAEDGNRIYEIKPAVTQQNITLYARWAIVE